MSLLQLHQLEDTCCCPSLRPGNSCIYCIVSLVGCLVWYGLVWCGFAIYMLGSVVQGNTEPLDRQQLGTVALLIIQAWILA